MDILAIIPARGGSVEIPKKNLQKVGNITLLERTIIHAKNSQLINRIIVSTDSKDIRDKAKKAGIEVPFLRPKQISGKYNTIIQVVKHTMTYFEKKEKYVPDILVILQPTTPFRTEKLIDKSIRKLIKNKHTSVISVKSVKEHPSIMFFKENNELIPFDMNFEKNTIRQKRKKLFCPNGSLYTFWAKNIQKYKSIYGPKIGSIIMKEDVLNLDIDNWFDLFIADSVFKNWKEFKKQT